MNIVYKTTNLVNGRFYYGVHCQDKPGYLGSGTAIQEAVAKYGRDNFKREIVSIFETEDLAYEFEGLLIDEAMVANPLSYNLVPGGRRGYRHFAGDNNVWVGRHHSEESRKKMSLTRTGLKRKPHSEATKEKMRIARAKQPPPSLATREKIRAARLLQPDPRLGKKHSAESNQKNRLAHLGKPCPRKNSAV